MAGGGAWEIGWPQRTQRKTKGSGKDGSLEEGFQFFLGFFGFDSEGDDGQEDAEKEHSPGAEEYREGDGGACDGAEERRQAGEDNEGEPNRQKGFDQWMDAHFQVDFRAGFRGGHASADDGEEGIVVVDVPLEAECVAGDGAVETLFDIRGKPEGGRPRGGVGAEDSEDGLGGLGGWQGQVHGWLAGRGCSWGGRGGSACWDASRQGISKLMK